MAIEHPAANQNGREKPQYGKDALARFGETRINEFSINRRQRTDTGAAPF